MDSQNFDFEFFLLNPDKLTQQENQINTLFENGFQMREFPEIMKQNFQRTPSGFQCYQYRVFRKFSFGDSTNIKQDPLFGFLIPFYVQDLIPFIRLNQSKAQKIYVEAFDEPITISKQKEELLFQFTVEIFMDLYSQLPKFKSKFFPEFDEIQAENRSLSRNIYIFPQQSDYGLNSNSAINEQDEEEVNDSTSIDFQKIQNFLQTKNEVIATNIQASLNKMEQNCHLGNNYSENIYYTTTLGVNQLVNIFDSIQDPCVEKALVLFQKLWQFADQDHFGTLDKVMQYYGVLTKEQRDAIFNLTINEFIFQYQFEKLLIDAKYQNNVIRNFQSLRKFFYTNNIESINSKKLGTLYFYQNIPHLSAIQFFNKDKGAPSTFRVKKLLKPFADLCYGFQLENSKLSLQELDNFAFAPTFFIQFQRLLVVKECGVYIGGKGDFFKTRYLYQALNSAACENLLGDNYQVLELVGDSVIQYIASCYLFTNFQHSSQYHDQSFYSGQRIHYIQNKFLSVVGFYNRLYFFARFIPLVKTQDWLPPFSQKGITKSIINIKNLRSKNIADVLEAIVGASFLSGYNCQKSRQILENLRLPFSKINFRSQEMFTNLLRTEKHFIKGIGHSKFFCFIARIYDLLNENSSYRDLFSYQSIQEYSIRSFEDFENVIGHKFKNKSLLLEAFSLQTTKKSRSYEILQFLGDAILELFVAGNAFHYWENFKTANSPGTMHMIKACLLSNSFMGRMAVMLGLDHLMIRTRKDDYENLDQEFEQFQKLINLDAQFYEFVRAEASVPQILSDMWQSLAAALILEGGWELFCKVHGQIYLPFIVYIVKYQEIMRWNVYEEFRTISKVRGQMMEVQTTETNKNQFLTQVYLGIQFIASDIGPSQRVSQERAIIAALQKVSQIDDR